MLDLWSQPQSSVLLPDVLGIYSPTMPSSCAARAVYPTSNGTVVEFVATGQEFQYSACLVLDVSEETGLVENMEDYYTKAWYHSCDFEGYRSQPAVGEKK
jgi:hypothetical protein